MDWISTELGLPTLRQNNESESDEVLVWVEDKEGNEYSCLMRLCVAKRPDDIKTLKGGIGWYFDIGFQQLEPLSLDLVKYWMPITEPSKDLRNRQLEPA